LRPFLKVAFHQLQTRSPLIGFRSPALLKRSIDPLRHPPAVPGISRRTKSPVFPEGGKRVDSVANEGSPANSALPIKDNTIVRLKSAQGA
jgi:hypothetical protein